MLPLLRSASSSQPDWLKTPLRDTMLQGTAKLVSTARRTLSVVLEEEVAAAEATVPLASSDKALADDHQVEEDSDEFEALSGDEAVVSEPEAAQSVASGRPKRTRSMPKRTDAAAVKPVTKKARNAKPVTGS